MHPILGSRFRLALYLLGWTLIGLMLAGVVTLAGVRPPSEAIGFALPLAVVYANVCLSAWWVCRRMPIDRSGAWQVLVTLVTTAGITSVLWALAAGAWSDVVDRAVGPTLAPDGRRTEMMIVFAAGVPLYLLSAMVHYLMIAVEGGRAAERLAYEAQVSARDAELRALRAQLHPHFLFNSLNSINALVVSNPEAARDMCEGLGEFYRKTLSLGAREAVPLADEMAMIHRYLEVERVRFGDRLGSAIEVTPEAARCAVPPLLLQPLVENAVKHGVSERLEGGTVRIEARRAEGYLVIAVENPVDDDAAGGTRKGEKVGLDNVRRRLEALDRRDTRLSVERGPGRYRVTLVLPATESGPAVGAPPAAPAPREEPHGR
jgi:hypothetical protein